MLPSYRRWQHSGKMNKYWNEITNPPFDVTLKLHGIEATLPSNYVYPLIIRAIPSFNDPYLELVNQVFKWRRRKLIVADIGAAIGDTFLLLQGNVPEALDKVVCIEGSEKFFPYLKTNTASFPHCVAVNELLSDKPGKIPSLSAVHGSSFSAAGSDSHYATMLDTIWPVLCAQPPDIIKTDTDGYDGKILAGAAHLLKTYSPAVIFEFHPLLLQAVANSFSQSFDVLQECGYQSLLWYDKKGNYSNISAISNKERIDAIVRQCIEAGEKEDMHYDVIALPVSMNSLITGLQDCRFAKNKKAPV